MYLHGILPRCVWISLRTRDQLVVRMIITSQSQEFASWWPDPFCSGRRRGAGHETTRSKAPTVNSGIYKWYIFHIPLLDQATSWKIYQEVTHHFLENIHIHMVLMISFNCKRSIAKVLALMPEAFVVSDPYMYPVFFIKVCLSYSVRIKC